MTEFNSFRPVKYNAGDALTAEKLNREAANSDYLLERLPEFNYTGYNFNLKKNLKVLAGVGIIEPHALDFAYLRISFGTFFDPSCRPIITATVAAHTKVRKTLSIQSIQTSTSPIPDNQGFIAVVWSGETTPLPHFISRTYVHYMAMGF